MERVGAGAGVAEFRTFHPRQYDGEWCIAVVCADDRHAVYHPNQHAVMIRVQRDRRLEIIRPHNISIGYEMVSWNAYNVAQWHVEQPVYLAIELVTNIVVREVEWGI